MSSPAQAAGDKRGAGTPKRAAILLAVASGLAGCAIGPGDLGRPRQSALDIAIDKASPATTLAERERNRRMRHFRLAPPDVLAFAPNARLNALRDAAEVDRMLLAPLVPALAASRDRQRIRDTGLRQFPALTDETRQRAREAIGTDEAIQAELCPLLQARTGQYRASLENAVVLAPEDEAVAAERSLLALEAAVERLCGVPAAPVSGPPLPIRK